MTKLTSLEFIGRSSKAMGRLEAYRLLSNHPNKALLHIKLEGRGVDMSLMDYVVPWWYRAFDRFVPLRWRLQFVDREKN